MQHQPGLLGVEMALGMVQLGHQLPELPDLGEGKPGQRLLDELDTMRALEKRASVDRSHEDPARCRGCGFRSVCDQKL